MGGQEGGKKVEKMLRLIFRNFPLSKIRVGIDPPGWKLSVGILGNFVHHGVTGLLGGSKVVREFMVEFTIIQSNVVYFSVVYKV